MLGRTKEGVVREKTREDERSVEIGGAFGGAAGSGGAGRAFCEGDGGRGELRDILFSTKGY